MGYLSCDPCLWNGNCHLVSFFFFFFSFWYQNWLPNEKNLLKYKFISVEKSFLFIQHKISPFFFSHLSTFFFLPPKETTITDRARNNKNKISHRFAGPRLWVLRKVHGETVTTWMEKRKETPCEKQWALKLFNPWSGTFFCKSLLERSTNFWTNGKEEAARRTPLKRLWPKGH